LKPKDPHHIIVASRIAYLLLYWLLQSIACNGMFSVYVVNIDIFLLMLTILHE